MKIDPYNHKEKYHEWKENSQSGISGFSEQNFKDVDEKTIKEFIKKANSAKRINFRFTNISSVLNKLHLIKKRKMLKAAEVLFCNKNNLEIQAAVFAGKDKVTFLDIKQFKGNLFSLLEQSEAYIKEHMDWRAELKTRERKEIPEIPVRAITEALVNSLCHRDYTNPKGNEVAIFKDRIEIYNPGQFPEGYSPEDFIKGEERSILRNPLIANTLYLSRDIEKWGSGIKRIYEACKEEDVKVEFRKLKSGFAIIFYRKGVSEGASEGVSEGVNSVEKLLESIMKNPGKRTPFFEKKLKVPAKTLERWLKQLKDKGKIIFQGSPKKGGYYIKEQLKGNYLES